MLLYVCVCDHVCMCVLIVCLCVYGLGQLLPESLVSGPRHQCHCRPCRGWVSSAPVSNSYGKDLSRSSCLNPRGGIPMGAFPVRAQDDSTSAESQNILESLNIETAVLPKGR